MMSSELHSPCRTGTYFCVDKSVTAVVIKVGLLALQYPASMSFDCRVKFKQLNALTSVG